MDFSLSEFGLPDPEDFDRWDEEGKGKVVKLLQDGGTIPDIIVVCKFMLYVGAEIKDYADMLTGLTGWEIDGWELLEIGERVINLQKLFNQREGFDREDDMIHPRMGKIPAFGKYKDQKDCAIYNYIAMLDEYYQERGWDKETGRPLPERLKKLGLEAYIT